PGVLVDLVLVADARQKPPALQREAAAEGERLEERLLDLELVFRRQRGRELTAKVGIGVAGDEELRFAQAEAARRRLDFAARRREAGDLIRIGVERAARGGALEDERNVGVERVRASGPSGLHRRRRRRRRGFLRLGAFRLGFVHALFQLLHLLLELPQRFAQLREL